MTTGIDNAARRTADIAIVGMAARLPGAGSIGEYWANLRGGVCSIRALSEEELREAGETPERMAHPNFVAAAAPLDHYDRFDGEFFGFSPKEAAIMDPQHRQFLEVAWEALETAGHPPEGFPGRIGVYAGCGMGSYFYFNLCSNRGLVDDVGMFLLRHTGNDKDFLSTRLSHILDLKGPSVSMQTACSTSLVTTHYAVRALLAGDCDMAIAGGVTIELPQGRGYIFEDGEILSPDGLCHAFDHRAQGTVFGSGAGVVVLRRLEDALADGDHIWAVIKGTAVNNDGAAKAGYLAPSVDGQAEAVAAAHAAADVDPSTIDYVECHGTGTYLGDPIEVAALTEAFRLKTEDTGFCRIGSVKTNIGHLDTAAGAASLIKAALGLTHKEIPPSLGYEAPNPAIDFETGPFKVNDRLTPWPGDRGPRRAGVNSLGVGGTNAHVILEEAPERAASEESDWPFQLLVVSGRTKAAVDANAKALAAHLRKHPEEPLADVAWTLKEGRRAFERRRVLVAETHEDAAQLLEETTPRRVFDHTALEDPEVVFMFPGGGAQFAGMARDLYETEPVFAEWMDRGLEFLEPKLDYDIRALWLPEPGKEAEADAALTRPSVQLPLIMITEYALAQLWMSWGVTPAAMIGHSMGENAAACLAGVMSFEDCIGLVHLRGQLFDTVPAGGMLSVPLSPEALAPYMTEALDTASINAPELTVVSGPDADLVALAERLAADEIEAQRVPIDIAAHSRMLEPILGRFGDYLRSIELKAPEIPVISNRTGQPLTPDEATDPDYWVRHLRNTVLFAEGISTLAEVPNRVYLEVGPGKALGSLTQMHGAVPAQQVLSSLRHPKEEIADDVYFMGLVGRLWALGVAVDWDMIWGGARRNRVVLPTYAFQGQSYFIEPARPSAVSSATPTHLEKIEEIADWGWQPVWRPRLAECDFDVETELDRASTETPWLVFTDRAGLAARAVARLRAAGHRAIEVVAGDAFAREGEDLYVLPPERGREGYDALIADLMARGLAPTRIAHFWLVTSEESFRPGSNFFHRNLEQGFYSLMFLAQAIADEALPLPAHVTVFTTGAAQVRGEALPYPEKATILGPQRMMGREVPGLTCSTLDVVLPEARAAAFGGRLRNALADPFAGKHAVEAALDGLVSQTLEEMLAPAGEASAALRGPRRYERAFRPVTLPEETKDGFARMPENGVCLITGGFGGIGLTLAETLGRERSARIVLLSRRPLPAAEDRAAWLREHGPYDPVSRAVAAVEHLEAAGIEVMTVAADVCNAVQMRGVLRQVGERFGPVTALIHAAGVIDDGPMLAKTPGAVEEVFTPKIHGLQVLDELFPDGTLDLMVLFSSSSTVTAPAGQVDYIAANEYLNAYAKCRAGGKTAVVAINWGLWTEVGMAAEAVAERSGERPAAPVSQAGVPLLDEMTFDSEGHRLFTADYTLSGRWVLDQHRTAEGTALMPGTGYLELIAEALSAHGETGPFELRDLLFLRPLQVAEAETRKVRLRLRRAEAGYDVEVQSACIVDGRTGWMLHAQATVALGHVPAAGDMEPSAIQARCTMRPLGTGAVAKAGPQARHMAFGARWQVLQETYLGEGEGLARLALPNDFMGEPKEGYALHPALLDIATGWAMELIEGYEAQTLWVPVSYESVRVYRSLPAEIWSWVRNAAENTAGSETARFDVALFDAEGRVAAEIRGFQIRRLAAAAGFAAAAAPTAAEVEFDEADRAAAQPLSPGEMRLRHNLTQGIRPKEGAEAFVRALATGLPQVVVSSLDLDALSAQAAESDAEHDAEAGQSFARPELDSDYLAPRTDLERTLVGFWEDLLGVDQIGVEDSFFDLGGHSLIAVRLFAMIRKAYRVDFPISVLFEAPTIAKCAALIAERIGDTGETSADTEDGASEAAPPRRFTHLVAMHEGEGGPRPPFFLVAGMFGNVLNLRHLAHLLGTDRPFYGLQARGLYGDEEPHEDLVQAARDQIAEMRSVQPHGPYMLGGFSGGGITAYEIARQLEAAGEEVSLLVLLDTPLPRRPLLSRRDKALIKMAEFREQGLGYVSTWARNRIDWELRKLRRRFEEPEAAPSHQFHDARIEAAFRSGISTYEVRPWEGRVALYRPALDLRWQVSDGAWVSSEREYVYSDNDWTRYVPNLVVEEVPGDHDSMVLEPNVRVLAARMRAAIIEAEATRPQSAATAPAQAAE